MDANQAIEWISKTFGGGASNTLNLSLVGFMVFLAYRYIGGARALVGQALRKRNVLRWFVSLPKEKQAEFIEALVADMGLDDKQSAPAPEAINAAVKSAIESILSVRKPEVEGDDHARQPEVGQ